MPRLAATQPDGSGSGSGNGNGNGNGSAAPGDARARPDRPAGPAHSTSAKPARTPVVGGLSSGTSLAWRSRDRAGSTGSGVHRTASAVYGPEAPERAAFGSANETSSSLARSAPAGATAGGSGPWSNGSGGSTGSYRASAPRGTHDADDPRGSGVLADTRGTGPAAVASMLEAPPAPAPAPAPAPKNTYAYTDADTTGPFLAPIAHSPGLDGLRALAVLAVLAYHAGLGWMPGGLLGVDAFFVLSGFLITGLLIAEYRATRRIDLAAFWVRRARRLLPALLVLLLAIAGYAHFIAAPGDSEKIRIDALATLLYVANWRFAESNQSYFDHFSAPSPLLHTWSLAVEEQFYVLWPLIVYLLMRHSARTVDRWRGQRQKAQSAALTVAVLGAEASSLIGLGLLVIGVDPSRIYYGTDTRIQALLVGAALAVWRAQRTVPLSAQAKSRLGMVGAAAAIALLTIWATVDGQSRGLYAGGFLAVAIIVAVLVAAIVEVPRSPVARVLAFGPLSYIGRISYGLYLWHWPIFLTLTAGRTGITGPLLLLVRLAAAAACTLASFYLVENPIRRRSIRVPKPWITTPAALAGVVAVILVSTGSPAASVRSPADLDRLAQQVQSSHRTLPPVTADASGVRPVRMLVAGDSLATTLLTSQFGYVASSMHVQLADASMLGCGVARLPMRRTDGKPGRTTGGCDQWPERFAQRLRDTQPDVAALLVGRWEVTDQLQNGHWTHIGEPSFDAYLAGELDLAITTLSARGAKVVLFTTPAFAPREAPDGTQYPETKVERVVQFNKLLRAAAARHPGVATVINLAGVLTPGNRYTDRVNGIVTRDDGVHITAEGGRLVGQATLPQIVELVRATRTEPPVATPSAPPG